MTESEIDSVLDEYPEIKDKLSTVAHERDEYKKLYELVLLELERTRRHLFGQKKEHVDPNQIQLAFEQLQKQITPETDPEHTHVNGHHRRKRKVTPHGRNALPENLPEERIILVPPELEGQDLEQYNKIGEEVSETLEWRSASYVKVVVVRPKYVHKDAKGEGAQVLIADTLTKPIDKGLAGPGLLAKVAVDKYLDHLPLNRQSARFEREGIHLARSTLCNWVESMHLLCVPVVDAMWEDALKSDYVAVDATGVLVQSKGKCRRSHFWVMISDNGHVLFRYTRKHNKVSVKELLGDYKGYIQADAATVYDFLFTDKDCIEVGCWAHSRRRFFDSLSTDQERALIALGYIKQLFNIDRRTSNLPLKKRTRERAKRAGPILEKLFKWADKEYLLVLPESPIGGAIRYLTNQQQALSRFLEDGRIRLTNNLSESELRREAVGRNNWIFVGSDDGGVWNTTFVSLLASCQLFSIEPWSYMRDILCLLPLWPRNKVLLLAPKYWNETLKDPETQKLLLANPFRRISMPPTKHE